MTFPFSTHNYHLRFWMAAGGVDPDEDVRLVVLPPPYMVESLANRHVDGFCVGAPWNSVAVDLGIGLILHFVSEILPRAAEKVLAVRSRWARGQSRCAARGSCARTRSAADFVEDVANRDEVAAILAAPNRIGVAAEVIRRTLDGRLKVSPDGAIAPSDAICWSGARAPAGPIRCRRPGSTRRWCAGDRRRCRTSLCRAAMAVFRPDLYDAAVGAPAAATTGRIGAFAGPPFDPGNIAGHLASWRIGSVPVSERCPA